MGGLTEEGLGKNSKKKTIKLTYELGRLWWAEVGGCSAIGREN